MTKDSAHSPKRDFTLVHQPIGAVMLELYLQVNQALGFFDEKLEGGFAYVLEPFSSQDQQIQLRLVNPYTNVSALVISPSPHQDLGQTKIDISWQIENGPHKNDYGVTLDASIKSRFQEFLYASLTDDAKKSAATHPILRIIAPDDVKTPRGDFFNYNDPNKYPNGPT